jgi:hypothetical protein
MKKVIGSAKISELMKSNLEHFPKYTTYLINQAAQTAQATRPSIVGQLSEEYPKYILECHKNEISPSLEGWKAYHKRNYPNALQDALKRTEDMIRNFKAAMNSINEKLIKEWILDLLYDKTFYGFNLEATIKLYFAHLGFTVRNSTPEDESKNIDLYLDNKPYQIKPKSLDYKQAIRSLIEVPIITYYEELNSIAIEFEDTYLAKKLGK